MKSIVRTRNIGGSLVVTIPIEIVKTEMLEKEDVVEIQIEKVKRDFFGELKGLKPFTRVDRMKDRM